MFDIRHSLFKKLPLYWKIIIGLLCGVSLGWIAAYFHVGFIITDYVQPFGSIFISLLKLIAVPIVLITLIKGISDLGNLQSLSSMGVKTFMAYILSTIVAVSIGLGVGNIFEPGKQFTPAKQEQLKELYASKAQTKASGASAYKQSEPLKFLKDMVPSNLFKALSDNRNMLQVIFFALLFGISMLLVKPAKVPTVHQFFSDANTIVLKMVDLIMQVAPIGVFSLMAGLIVDLVGDDISDSLRFLSVLVYYMCVVLLGLATMAFIIYPLLIVLFTKHSYRSFLKAIAPAQLLAFSTSSSAATLPLTMRNVEENLKVKKEVSSFVLPLGATINMDGTSLFQVVSALFIAQALGIELSISTQIGIALTCTLASIGAAAVPGAGTVMLVVVLEQAHIPVEGIALILAVDRILDMFRTTVNVTGDAAIASYIDSKNS